LFSGEQGTYFVAEMAGIGGSSPHVVAVKLSAASQAAVSDSWTDSKLLSGDVVLQVSTDSGAVFMAPFAGGKAGLQREFRKLTNARGGLKVKVKRGPTILDVWVKVALDESSLLKKNYVLVSLLDATHVATLVDAIEQECIDLQGLCVCLLSLFETCLLSLSKPRSCKHAGQIFHLGAFSSNNVFARMPSKLSLGYLFLSKCVGASMPSKLSLGCLVSSKCVCASMQSNLSRGCLFL
jgi:hypothetical protein